MEALIFVADHVVDEGKFIDYGEKSVILKGRLLYDGFFQWGVLMGRNVAIGIQNYNEIIEKNYFM